MTPARGTLLPAGSSPLLVAPAAALGPRQYWVILTGLGLVLYGDHVKAEDFLQKLRAVQGGETVQFWLARRDDTGNSYRSIFMPAQVDAH
jgi:hypothetical protein